LESTCFVNFSEPVKFEFQPEQAHENLAKPSASRIFANFLIPLADFDVM